MKQNIKFLLVLLTLGFFFSCARAPQQLVSEKPVAPVVDLASEKIRDSIVWIESETASGTGFFIAPDMIATNTHVVAHIGSVSVKSPDKGKNWTIEGVVGFDAENSLVILKLTGEGTPLPLGDTVQMGESISILSYPDGTFKVLESRIQSLRKNNRWLRLNTTAAKKTDGSPVFNNNRQIIGVVVPYGGYAISSSVLEALLAESMPIEPLVEWQQRKQVRAAAYYGLGKEKLDAEDYTGALVDFDKAIELNPAYVRAYYERGRAQAYLGNYDSAIASCTQVIEIGSDASDAYLLRGSVKARIGGDYAAALIDLDRAIELDAQHADAYSNRGGIKYGLGESETTSGNAEEARSLYEAAIADCNKAIQIDPEDANTYNNRAAARLALGNFEEAILDLNRAIEVDPEDADAYNNRGLVKFRRGESEEADGNTKEAGRLYESAIADYTQAIAIDAADDNTYNNRGLAKTAFGELESTLGNTGKTETLYESAITDYTESIKMNPKSDLAYNNRGLMRFRLGNTEAARENIKEAGRLYESAIADYTQAIAIDAADDNTYNNRGLAKTAFGELESTRGNTKQTEVFYESAVADYIRAIEINPKYAEAYQNRAAVKCKLGDIESARDDAEVARKLYHEGITDFDKAIQLNNSEDVDLKAADLEFKKVGDSTVHIMSWAGTLSSLSTGSGFFVDEDKIVTNLHVIAQPGPVFVKLRGKKKICAVEGVTAFDAKNDLVVLKIAGEGIPLSVGDSEAIQGGEPVFVVGYPNKKYKIIKGTIHNAPNRGEWLWMNPRIGSGGSGSPTLMLNRSGVQVVGIYAAADEHYSYAIPSKALKALLAQSRPVEPLIEWHKRALVRAYAYFVQGENKVGDERYEEALVDYNRAIEINPHLFYAYYSRGEVKSTLGDYKAAIVDYDKVIEISDEVFHTYFLRGFAYLMLGDYKAAIVDYDKAIKVDPENNADAYCNRGAARCELAESERALGNTGSAQRLYEAAIADYDKAIEIDPEDAIAYSNRGAARYKLGISEAARGHLKKAQRLYAAAIEDCTQAIKINPEHANAYNNRGHVKEALGQKEAAKADFQKAEKLDPSVEK